MPKDTRSESVQSSDQGLVHLSIDALKGGLTLMVTIDNSTLTLPANHLAVECDGSYPGGLRTFRVQKPFREYVKFIERIGDCFTVSVHTNCGDNHETPLTQALLNCFTDPDREVIDQILNKLAVDRNDWWDKTLAQYAIDLGKQVDEIGLNDIGHLVTSHGQRDYPQLGPTDEHNTHPTLQVNLPHLERELRTLMTRLLNEVWIIT